MILESFQLSNEPILVRIDADIEALVPDFLKNRQADVHSIDAALSRADYQLIRRIGHSLKGTGAGYGFDALTEVGGHIEDAALDNNAERIRHWVAELGAYVRRVRVSYQADGSRL